MEQAAKKAKSAPTKANGNGHGEQQHQQQELWPSVRASFTAMNTVNPIRDLVDTMDIKGNPDKRMIALSIGDPTVFGNLPKSPASTNAVITALKSGKCDGYPHSAGYPASRKALAEYFSTDGLKYDLEDVVIASGCSGALDLAIEVFNRVGGNMLIPEPGFSLYKTLGIAKGLDMRAYQLLPDKSWEIDLADMEAKIDENTLAIIVNNPSNPCGSVYSEEHIKALIEVAARHKVPIIADEVYANMTFGRKFVPLASLAHNVPVLSCGGLAKRFLVPGWRVGWVLIHDPVNAFTENVRPGLLKLTQHILGANSLMQGAIPSMLKDTKPEFFSSVLSHLKENAELVCSMLEQAPGLTPIMPAGAMYLMVKLEPSMYKDIKDDRDFTQKLITEQSVFCLPASVFGSPNFFRIVTTIPKAQMMTAMERIIEFAKAHADQ
ncbi:tyrosine aminotransferase [Salpingoeca rosetta]|uniref:Tyrosine aminotransferase n=1 Tax=Salpingoeca rosetta (strain ATCC 50818 / BSB-021) TaxID=946362 RepID=F2U272_SALR5|nr:tyrosine aminotransferase [Salpingoeca rosetta]EGD81724.1 tyrosine aminotransferase [Salpingoeca rosetta]|eukprot:XP_004996928.1 tyrosine aminotransferase [Salpingoeca rosetta]